MIIVSIVLWFLMAIYIVYIAHRFGKIWELVYVIYSGVEVFFIKNPHDRLVEYVSMSDVVSDIFTSKKVFSMLWGIEKINIESWFQNKSDIDRVRPLINERYGSKESN